MFAVEWLRQGVTIERETSAIANVADAVAAARAGADVVTARQPRRARFGQADERICACRPQGKGDHAE
jgi:hypothetical protein